MSEQKKTLLDPSLENGYELIFERDIRLECRKTLPETSEDGSNCLTLHFKALVKGPRDDPESFVLEVFDDADVFFMFRHTMNRQEFGSMQTKEKLRIPFEQYPDVVCGLFNDSVEKPHVFMAVLYIQDNGEARLDFVQNIHIRFVELLSLELFEASEGLVHRHVQYRFTLMKQRLEEATEQVVELTAQESMNQTRSHHNTTSANRTRILNDSLLLSR